VSNTTPPLKAAGRRVIGFVLKKIFSEEILVTASRLRRYLFRVRLVLGLKFFIPFPKALRGKLQHLEESRALVRSTP
jgi:hypothetical protein